MATGNKPLRVLRGATTAMGESAALQELKARADASSSVTWPGASYLVHLACQTGCKREIWWVHLALSKRSAQA